VAALFRDRQEGGRALAQALRPFAARPRLLVLGLPRGGIPVAYEVARALQAPLDVFVVRKLGVPGYEELAMGAIASGGTRVLNRRTIRELHISSEDVERVAEAEQRELDRREQAYRGQRAAPEIRDRSVIVVDDGLATGATMAAAVAALREQHPAAIIVAAPVGAAETCAALRTMADDCVCAETPHPFQGVGRWYGDFEQTTDDEVRRLLDAAGRPGAADAAAMR
jgi:predicted phosphoribosyltransferase